MQVILLERIEKLGLIGDVVTVKPGYARNFLLPKKKAMRANKQNMEVFEQQRVQIEAHNLELRKEAESVAGKLEGLSVTLIRQAGESGQLYGSVNSRDLAASIGEAGVTILKSQIRLDQVIKSLGVHSVRVQLHPEVDVSITANVARSEEEANMQAKSGEMVTSESLREAADAADAEVDAAIAAAVADDPAPEAEAPSETGDNPDKDPV